MNAPPAYRLVVLRHGQSEWNAVGRFTGWVNAEPTRDGEREAARAGTLLAAHGLFPSFAHTSLQRRTICTANLALAAADRDWIPVRRSWRLNGRHYGALQGRSKAEVVQEYGEEQVRLWRRSYDVRPPPLAADAQYSQFGDPRYAGLPPEARPSAESLRDVSARLLPYWYDAIVPDLRTGGCVLVVSHGNTLRALVKHLDSMPDDRIADLELPTGIPLLYQLGPDLRPVVAGGQYLDPRRARDGIAVIQNQGRPARAATSMRLGGPDEQRTGSRAAAHRGRDRRLRAIHGRAALGHLPGQADRGRTGGRDGLAYPGRDRLATGRGHARLPGGRVRRPRRGDRPDVRHRPRHRGLSARGQGTGRAGPGRRG